ncbi:UPF0674 endoplasmic reticulum membrane protein [Vanrija pseudolonga]|uniref:UPF0674 endoplasmic reticulum membrane protein n=1 Tax=Vanrija pseudolonga TaxID=143232 RepID=A0AAF1BLW3_9TREE|nr:UPF0674 endoplasmic reticulum membrane protein [Vanrija pseudolonga]
MSGILQAIAQLTPAAPQQLSRDYDGVEYRWKAFSFRPAAFKFEGYMLAVLGGYVILHLLGKAYNTARAKKLYDPYVSLIKSQFTLVRPAVPSSSALHLLYATGRRNVLALHATLTLLPYHDIITLVYEFAWSIIEPTADISEGFTFGLTLGRGAAGLQGEGLGVWALVNKNSLKKVKEQRYDLSFPRLHESAAVPVTHTVFAEHSDVNDVVFKTANVGVTEVLADPVAADILKYLIITDQPSERPMRGALKPEYKAREISLAVYKPTNAEQEAAVAAWLQVALNLADLEGKPGLLKAEVARKIAKTRVEVDASLNSKYKKELEEDSPPEQTPEDKRLAKKKAERAQLSEKELKKVEELERKREMRKMQKRQMK